ncbi:hypothetical protein Q1695_003255 [Nippostrongylus brasiliensis]|nr:hypothetical protein Q1695_003255 [Nippostrongylus brasiliensis]
MRSLLVLLTLLVTVLTLRLKMEDRMALSHLTGMNRPGISDDDYNKYLSELGSQLFKRSRYQLATNSDD